MQKINKINYKIIILLLLISSLYLSFFSISTSPLTKYYYGSDSALFMLFGKMMKNGYIAYKDMFDHKGPYFFFLQEIGQIICEGRVGIFLLQIVSLTVSLYLTYIILESNTGNKIHINLIIICLLLLFIVAPLSYGNLTEEFALPFSLDVLRRTLSFYKNKQCEHNPPIAMIYGVYFSILAFSRLTNSFFLWGCILSIFIYLLINKKYKNIVLNIIFFIFGFIIATLPIIIYYYSKGVLYEMLYSVFIYASKYATNGSSLTDKISLFFSLNHFIYFFPILIPLFYIEQIDNIKRIYYYCITLFSFISVFLGDQLLHYYMLLVPNYIFSMIILLNRYKINKIKELILIGLILFSCLFAGIKTIKEIGVSLLRIADYSYTLKENNYYLNLYKEENSLVSCIPEKEKNEVWGYKIKAKFYLKTNTYPAIKYFDYLDQLNDRGEKKDEIISLLSSKNVKWIVLMKEDFENAPDYLLGMITGLMPYNETEHYLLYKLEG